MYQTRFLFIHFRRFHVACHSDRILDFSGIRTVIVIVEGENNEHQMGFVERIAKENNFIHQNFDIIIFLSGSGGGSVGRAVASDFKGPRFESSHRQKFILNSYSHLYWKDGNKKEAGNGPFLKKTFSRAAVWPLMKYYLRHIFLFKVVCSNIFPPVRPLLRSSSSCVNFN